jgi:DNA-binding IclR family transcriptional regulator
MWRNELNESRGLGRQEQDVNRTEGAQAIGRATEILRVVARIQRSGATLANVCRATNLSRSTAFRILRSLTEERLLNFDQDAHRYYIGSLAYELGLAAQGPADLIARWRERIDRTAVRTGLTTYLVARSDSEVVCLSTAQGTGVIRAVPLVVGQRLPLGVGAGSLAILSSLPDEEVDEVLTANAHKYALHGGGRLTPAILRKRIELTRENGFAFSQDSVAAGVAGVGIVASHGHAMPQLALSVSMPLVQLDQHDQGQLATIIREAVEPDSRAA